MMTPSGPEKHTDPSDAVNSMAARICGILQDSSPSIYLYGSVTLGDFRPGFSDIDILVLTDRQISEEQAQHLVHLRQEMLRCEPSGNRYYRLFEGGMLSLDAFLTGNPDRVVYWGTSGERITDTYRFDSFCMTELIENGLLLCGNDIRDRLVLPGYDALCADIRRHLETVRKYARNTERSLYSFGWLLDITRCIYTLRTGKIIAKTDAAEWALENGLCPDPDALEKALMVRKNPLRYKDDAQIMDCAETLARPVQRFADVLEYELTEKH